MDLSEVDLNPVIKHQVINFANSVDKISELLNQCVEVPYDKLSTKEKVDYDLFMCYCLNTLFWLYLRTKGVDPNTNAVKNELTRVRDYMLKAKQVHDRNTIRPRIDKDVAGRFIRSGMWNPKDKSQEPPNKRIKFD